MFLVSALQLTIEIAYSPVPQVVMMTMERITLSRAGGTRTVTALLQTPLFMAMTTLSLDLVQEALP